MEDTITAVAFFPPTRRGNGRKSGEQYITTKQVEYGTKRVYSCDEHC